LVDTIIATFEGSPDADACFLFIDVLVRAAVLLS
jgi:hypothetical protein